jgi:tRNA C32,U32 (ribose-2'-O)-methylase TrmJ
VEEAIKDLEYVVGTKPGKGAPLKQFQPRKNMSIMIGRESSGLSNQELNQCDSTIHIETGKHSSLNQSHATAILLHHFHQKEKQKTDIQQLQAIQDEVGEITMKLLKRSSPTQQELNALIAETKKDE